MPKEYEPLTFDRSKYSTYAHYIAYIRSLTANPYEVIDKFWFDCIEMKEEETPRVHAIELYREFVLFGHTEEKLLGDISKVQFFGHIRYYSGGAKQTYYSLGYFPNLLVPKPVSQSLIKLYRGDKVYAWKGKEDYCTTCMTPLDHDKSGMAMECLVCKINRDKKIWSKYHGDKKRENLKKKWIQAPKD